MKLSELAILIGVVLTGAVSLHCSAPGADMSETQGSTTSKMVSSISSHYGITSFGGPGDYQSMACGANSRTANKWYVASSQRYGCHQHLKLTTTTGKCVVVSTEDAGPATFVEQDAGMPILDSSPAVGSFLFGESSLGWSDVKAHPTQFSVNAAKTTDPVGPCSGGGAVSTTDDDDDSTSTTDDDDDNTSTTDDDDDDSTSGSTSGGGGQSCSNDGQCNPGNDGAGLICSGGTCVPGCHKNANCPGNTTCVSGQCR